MRCWLRFLLNALVALMVASCTQADVPTGIPALTSGGRAILLWHSLSPQAEQALNTVLGRYQAVNPSVRIILQSFDSASLLHRDLIAAANAGLGPDLALVDGSRVPELVARRTIRPLDSEFSKLSADRFLDVSLLPSKYAGEQYLVPVSMELAGFYVSAAAGVPSTLDELTAALNQGGRLAVGTELADSVWALRGFGATIFNAQGEPGFYPSATVNWLTWLQQQRDVPGWGFEVERDNAVQRFIGGDADYLIASSNQLLRIRSERRAAFRLAPLPDGSGGPGGPLLSAAGFVFNRSSSSGQYDAAREFVIFMTNPEQQTLLAREAGFVPTNASTRLAASLYPELAVFQTQARTAVPVVNSPEGRQTLAALEIAQQRVLEGLMGPSQAVTALGEEMAMLGIASSDDQAVICLEGSTFRLALIDSAEFSEPIRHLLRDFSTVCPGIRVLVDEYDGDALLQSLFSGQSLQIQADLLLISKDTLLVTLNPSDVLDAQPLFDTSFFQRFRPFAIEPMRRGSQLLGVPVSFSTQVLFFNRSLVRDPALTLADLRAQASAGLPIVLSTNLLEGAAWGVGAFETSGGDDLTQWATPITAWLDWLNQAKQLPNVTLVQTGEEQRQAFIEGRSAYFVGGPDDLLDMRIAMGSTNVGVTTLPSGETQARPWLTLNSLIFNSGSSSLALAGARRFTEYVTSLDAQQALLDDFFRMPVHSNVDTSREPAASVFIAQAQGATYDTGKVELFYVLALTSKLFNEALFGDIAVGQVAVAMPYLIDALVPAIQASHRFTMPLASGLVITDAAAAQTPYFGLSLSLPDISPVIADLNEQLAAALGTDIDSGPAVPDVSQPSADQNGIAPVEPDTGTLVGVLAADALAIVELVRAVPVPSATTFMSGAEPATGASMFMLDPDAVEMDPALEGTEISGTLPITSPAALPEPATISPTLTAPVTDTVTLPEPP